MALFIDGPISSIEDLHGYDTQLLEVAGIEGIDVTRKLVEAQDEIGIDLRRMLSDVCSTSRIANVVVTAPLRLWHMFRALDLVYRDAFNSQLNDRYAGKRNEYHEMARWAHERLIQSGLGMAADPIRQAPTPVTHVAGGGLAEGTYYVAIAWTNLGAEEGATSLPAKITVAGSSLDVRHGEPPANTKGWQVYVGSSPTTMMRQNAAVLVLGTTWVQPDTVAAGKPTGTGQAYGFLQPIPRVIQRG
jgi:hypothetical protein